MTVSREGVYQNSTHDEVHGTLVIFQHLHAFLKSDCKGMLDPFDHYDRAVWDKARTQRELKKPQ